MPALRLVSVIRASTESRGYSVSGCEHTTIHTNLQQFSPDGLLLSSSRLHHHPKRDDNSDDDLAATCENYDGYATDLLMNRCEVGACALG